MEANYYQLLAGRTECSSEFTKQRMVSKLLEGEPEGDNFARLIHAQWGICSEAGELASALEKAIAYGQHNGVVDVTNIKEELGDLMWYVAQMCSALNITLASVMVANIKKLEKRYPEKFSTHASIEENRNLDVERTVLGESGNE